MFKILFSLLLSATLFAELIDGIAVLVKKEPITLYEIEKAMQADNLDRKEALELLIRKKLEEQEIQERGISVSGEEVYDEIKRMAMQNNMSVSELYDAMYKIRGLDMETLKQRVREKLLSQKLYSAIAFSSMSQPSEEDAKEYYELHKELFSYYRYYDVVAYTSRSKRELQTKRDNPMFYSPSIKSESATLESDKINPQLKRLLANLEENSFSPILPTPDGHFVSFFLKSRRDKQTLPYAQVSSQVKNMIMQDKREKVLRDYFARAKLNAEIEVLRLTKE